MLPIQSLILSYINSAHVYYVVTQSNDNKYSIFIKSKAMNSNIIKSCIAFIKKRLTTVTKKKTDKT